jgi:hypothetical protein
VRIELANPLRIRLIDDVSKCPLITVSIRSQSFASSIGQFNPLFSLNWIAVNAERMEELLSIRIGRQ